MTTDRTPVLRALATALVHHPAASMEQLAQSIGVSRATLHRQVSSRDELLREIAKLANETCLATFRRLNLEEGEPEPALAQLVQALTPDADFYLFLRRNFSGREHLHEYKNDWDVHRKMLVSFFQRGQEAGVFRIDLPAQWLVDAFGALLFSAAESVQEGRLARADMEHVVYSLMLDGTRRRPAA